MGDLSKRFYSIRTDREFRYLYKKGESTANRAYVCYYKKNSRRRNRCGIVTAKKIGNAVRRNRSRRVIKQAFRIFDHELCAVTEKRFDLIFIARHSTAEMKSTDILGIMRHKLLPLLTDKKSGIREDTSGSEKNKREEDSASG